MPFVTLAGMCMFTVPATNLTRFSTEFVKCGNSSAVSQCFVRAGEYGNSSSYFAMFAFAETASFKAVA